MMKCGGGGQSWTKTDPCVEQLNSYVHTKEISFVNFTEKPNSSMQMLRKIFLKYGQIIIGSGLEFDVNTLLSKKKKRLLF